MMQHNALIRINGASSRQQSNLIAALEANLDLDQVVIQRTEVAVKSIIPLEILIEAATGELLEKLILKPLIDAVTDKFDWKKAVAKYGSPIEPFSIVIHLTDENLAIRTEPDLYLLLHKQQAWECVQNTIHLLRKENLYSKMRKIRLIAEREDEIFMVCYENNKPSYIVNPTQNYILQIVEGSEEFSRFTISEDKSDEAIFQHYVQQRNRYEEHLQRLRDEHNKQ